MMPKSMLENATDTGLDRSVVAVHSGDNVCGVGFFITNDHFFTCSHVVEEALQISTRMRSRKPTGHFDVSFPFIDPTRRYKARVARWTAADKQDLATIQIVDDPLPDVVPAKFVPISRIPSNAEVVTFGFPAGYSDGVWSRGVFVGIVANKRMQINQSTGEPYVVSRGFSGSPIWLQSEKCVVGIVRAFDESPTSRAFYGIHSDDLTAQFPFEARRGSMTWALKELRSYMFVQLLNDLNAVERAGLDDRKCGAVKNALALMVHAASEAPQSAFWHDIIVDELERFEDVYIDWNSPPPGSHVEHHAIHRREKLKVLRDQKDRIRHNLRRHGPLLANELDRTLVDDIYEAFDEMSSQYPNEFRNVRKAVDLYKRKKAALV